MCFEFPLCIILKFITNEPIRYTQLQIINELNPFLLMSACLPVLFIVAACHILGSNI